MMRRTMNDSISGESIADTVPLRDAFQRYAGRWPEESAVAAEFLALLDASNAPAGTSASSGTSSGRTSPPPG